MSNITNNTISEQVKRRKTFAIISHPDAGKTTMTEKLLLYSGAIRLAGSVKARKTQRHAVSDWMDIEKERGISVTSSALQFEYDGYMINILDTPGHQDFSEDTYRTLVAADSAVMLIDAAKGVETQTIKLFRVCRMRNIPIFTFVNKMDRAAKDPFELMEEIENVLGIRSYPMNWPIGTDGDFQGVYNRVQKRIELYEGGDHGQTRVSATKGDVQLESFKELLGEYYHSRLAEEIELLDMAGDEFDNDKIQNGTLTPMFFGSAMTNFGVEPFLKEFLNLAPSPGKKMAGDIPVDPEDSLFSGFVFKIQANMNPAHRDRIAFIRVCSGAFKKGMAVWHIQSGKEIRLALPQQLMAQDRNIIDEAYAGDIIGLFDPGIFGLGDTLSEKKKNLQYDNIPTFPAEFFARVAAKDSSKRKQFEKGINQLSSEGAIQIFKQPSYGADTTIVGAVGILQIEVLEHRLKNEYGVDLRITHLTSKIVKWVTFTDESVSLDKLTLTSSTICGEDEKRRPVLFFDNSWSFQWALDKNKGLKLLDSQETM